MVDTLHDKRNIPSVVREAPASERSSRFQALTEIAFARPLETLSVEQLRELQIALHRLGYPVGDIDGLYGPKTRSAWAEFKIDVFPGNPTLVGPQSLAELIRLATECYESAHYDFSSMPQVKQAICDECKKQGIGLPQQIAYVLATVQWETAQTFEPVKEAFWLSEEWRKHNLRYYPYYGRGYVQLTWENNYRKYQQLLGAPLVQEPDLAMQPEIALFVLTHGFMTGAFTGHKISDYINENKKDFLNARRCINGRDRAHEIAEIAQGYLAGGTVSGGG
ncbi:glycoside hydrolase family 19 protein [Hahella aquimaris]|uniref:peptidoglycan-binding protein n=1 Tax=Hahella sp. HNIBRBA332 TaxID=3015983 RepID=UPI00273B1CB5|nr:peptidoglycan-binding protein [Hahella sp. HNIBRBA332]WLQ12532.1 glycoside hydrolase family 19 protein [Hahella sp. HNIBRBA332]